MFAKLEKTTYPPKKPMMIWDGNCGFCHYWVIRWMMITGDKIEYKKYQDVSKEYKDIDPLNFKEAARLIEPDGSIYNGPEAAYRAYFLTGKSTWWYYMYKNMPWFRGLSDYGYDFIAKNRSLMMKLTIKAFGKDPRELKPYWIVYLAGFVVIMLLLSRLTKED